MTQLAAIAAGLITALIALIALAHRLGKTTKEN